MKIETTKNLQFGEPWQPDEDSLSVVVPVLWTKPLKRNYICLEEVSDKVKFTDTGQIDYVKASSECDKPVFVRSGTMLEGIGSQDRAVTVSTVIMPQEQEVPIAVRCIQQSHGISGGSGFRVAGTAPKTVHLAMLSGDQSSVWSSVSAYNTSCSRSYSLSSMTPTGSGGVHMDMIGTSDNLVGTTKALEQVGDFKKSIDSIMRRMPRQKNQVGVVILDIKGVAGLEIFNSPESWKAVSKDVIKKYGETLTKKQEKPLFEFKKDRVIPKIMKFLEKLQKVKRKLVFRKKDAKTFSLTGEGLVGEYTEINGKMIHMVSLREEKTPEAPRTGIGLATLGTYRSAPTNIGYMSATTPSHETIGIKSTDYHILSSINQGANRWKSLKTNLPVSQGNLANRLRSFEQKGLIDKTPSVELGKPTIRYNLTQRGKGVLLSMNGIRKNLEED